MEERNPFAISQPPHAHVVRRLGPKASHIDCACRCSWAPIIELYPQGQDFRFLVEVEPQALSAEERDGITSQVQRIDGSGGLAPYEDFGIVRKSSDLARSIAAVCLRTGVVVLSSGDLQQPLFVLPDPTLPARWDIEEFPGD